MANSLEFNSGGVKHPDRRFTIVCALLGAGVLGFLFWGAYADLVSAWYRESTYNYAFLVPLTSLYIVHLRRNLISHTPIKPSFLGILYMTPFSLLWLLSSAADVSLGLHIAAVGLVQGLLLTFLGRKLFIKLFFPIQYLWLAVPTWQFLVSPLQQVSAAISSFLIDLSGVPLFVDGLLLEIPTGLYRVAPECSGLNFLIAALALSLVFANIFYLGWKKRLLAVVISLLLAIIANGLRIAAIILFNHIGGHEVGIAGDHLTWGWGFFAVVMSITIFIALRFCDDVDSMTELSTSQLADESSKSGQTNFKKQIAIYVSFLLVAASPVIYMTQISKNQSISAEIQLPAQLSGYTTLNEVSVWRPDFDNAHGLNSKSYVNDEGVIDFFVAYYDWQNDQHEMISYSNSFVGDVFNKVALDRSQKIKTVEPEFYVTESLVSGSNQIRLVWHWYWVDGHFRKNEKIVKLLQAKTSILLGDTRTAAIAISTNINSDIEIARLTLANFAMKMPTALQLLENVEVFE